MTDIMLDIVPIPNSGGSIAMLVGEPGDVPAGAGAAPIPLAKALEAYHSSFHVMCLIEDEKGPWDRAVIPDAIRDAGRSVQRRHLPIKKAHPPTAHSLIFGWGMGTRDVIHTTLARSTLYLDCGGDAGIANTFAAMLLSDIGFSPAIALAHVHHHRSSHAPETRAQIDFLTYYASRLVPSPNKPGRMVEMSEFMHEDFIRTVKEALRKSGQKVGSFAEQHATHDLPDVLRGEQGIALGQAAQVLFHLGYRLKIEPKDA